MKNKYIAFIISMFTLLTLKANIYDLYLAIDAEDNLNAVQGILAHNDIDINTIPVGYTEPVLHKAIRKKSEDLVSILLRYNADVNITNKAGRTAIHIAVIVGNSAIIELLLNKSFDINASCDQGYTILHYLAVCTIRNSEYNKFKELLLIKLLDNKDIDANFRSRNGDTPFHLAAKNNNIFMVQTMLDDLRVNVNEKNNDIETALLKAINSNSIDCIKILLNSLRVEIHEEDKFGHSPLDKATIYAFYQIFNYQEIRNLLEEAIISRRSLKAQIISYIRKNKSTFPQDLLASRLPYDLLKDI